MTTDNAGNDVEELNHSYIAVGGEVKYLFMCYSCQLKNHVGTESRLEPSKILGSGVEMGRYGGQRVQSLY